MSSFILRGIAAQGTIRVVATDTTTIVQNAKERHSTSPTATAALGRTLSSTLLLSHVLLKNPKDRVTVKVLGDGVLGGIVAEGGLDGIVRGYVKNPQASMALRSDGKLNVGGAVGKGDLEVIRSHAPNGEPYTSSVKLVSGEIAEDIAVYLAQSEQINSAVLLGVYLEKDEVLHAGGILLQALPDVQDAALALVEANVRALGSLTQAMGRMSLLEIMEELCWGLELEILTKDALPARLECRCSEARILEAMSHFSNSDIQEMIDQEGGAEAVCHWCNERYWLGGEKLARLLKPTPEGALAVALDENNASGAN